MTRIGFDAFGGDLGLPETVKAAVMAAEDLKSVIVLYGDETKINEALEKEFLRGSKLSDKSKLEIVHCTEVVENEDVPTRAIRSKKDSSLVVGLQHLKGRKIDAFVTGGNTGATLAGGIFVVGRIKGISRPAICTIFPAGKTPSVLLDTGANAEVKPENLLEFALMGSEYAKVTLGVDRPSVGLVNVGVEPHKGDTVHQEGYALLKDNKIGINFVGNIEGREAPTGDVNVLVCDGFSGNVLLKTTEGVAKELLSAVKGAIMSSFMSKIGGLLIKKSLKNLKKRLDYTEYGGAPILGVDGVLVKAHGSSNAKAFFNAIKYAEKAVDAEIVEKIRASAAILHEKEAESKQDEEGQKRE